MVGYYVSPTNLIYHHDWEIRFPSPQFVEIGRWVGACTSTRRISAAKVCQTLESKGWAISRNPGKENTISSLLRECLLAKIVVDTAKNGLLKGLKRYPLEYHDGISIRTEGADWEYEEMRLRGQCTHHYIVELKADLAELLAQDRARSTRWTHSPNWIILPT